MTAPPTRLPRPPLGDVFGLTGTRERGRSAGGAFAAVHQDGGGRRVAALPRHAPHPDHRVPGHARATEETAGELFVSPLTVRTRVHRAVTELDARGRAQLVVTACQSGLVQDPPPVPDA